MDKQQKPMVSPITLFYSYAHEDEELRDELEKHLSLLRRQGLISEWHDRQILAGDEWAADIDQHLETASIILLLISPDFLASDYCYDTEMQRALERHQRGEARVIPIILRPCDWRTSPFARLQCLPRDGKAVTTWQNPDEAFLTIAEGLRRVIERQQIPARPLSHVERQNRTRLMKRVRVTWIKGVLEHSLHQTALIALDLQEQPDALANPWQLEVQETNLPPHLLPAGTPLVEVYDEAEGELLILGEPGAGKTTLLLQLARDLLKRSEQDSASPIPVIFNLSSWAEKRLPLTDWLIEELLTKYQVPRHIGRSWVKDDQLLLLLDGLDEVIQVHRTACIQAINMYRQGHTLVPVVLCSRKAEYEGQSTRVTLYNAVVIQPLTSQQIDGYLTQAGQQLEAVRSVLHQDQELQELARTPLMLTILALAYQGKVVDDLVRRMPPDIQRRHVLGMYVERMLQRRAASHYTPDQTKHWLAWLAQQMTQHNQTEFYLERMQPNWLPENQSRRLYRAMVGGLVYGQVSGLISGLAYGLVSGLIADLFLLRFGLLTFVLVCMLIFTLIGGLVGGSINIRDTEIKPAEVIVWSWGNMWRRLVESLIIGLVGWLVFRLISLLVFTLIGRQSLWALILIFVLPYVLTGGVVGGLFNRSPSENLDKHNLIMPHQSMLRSVLLGMLIGLAVTLGVSLVGGLVLFQVQILDLRLVSKSVRDLIVGLGSGLESGFVVGLIVGLFSGLSRDKLDEHDLEVPNQGIRCSARNGMRIGLIGGLLSGLVSGLTYGLLSGLAYGQITGLVRGLIGGLLVGWVVGWVVGLMNGGTACIKHTILRWLLWRAEHISWNYPSFLDYAAERVLLRKVGGGYIFPHRLLLEYFASLDTRPAPNEDADRA